MKVSNLSEVEKLRETIQNAEQQFSEIEIKIQQMRENLHTKFKTVLEKHQISQIDEEFLESFFEEPYVMIPKRGHEWYVIVPKWLNMQVGYLEHSTKSYNIFIVNKYVQWLSEIPETLREKLKFPKPLPIKIFDGMLLTGSELQNQIFEKYRDYVTSRSGKDRIKIKPGYEFKLIAQLIEEGTLPFMTTPIVEEDMRPWTGLGKEAYDKICREKNILDIQEKAWNEFKQRGAMGIFWAFGTGKSLFGHRLIGQIKGDKLVVVPTLTLKDQWLERLKTFNPTSLNEVKVETYHAYEKVRALPRKLVIFDECQHLPANTYIRLSTIPAKYRVGFSGSPFREDGRENYIIALTGFPLGMAWEDLLRLQIIQAPQFRVYIVDNKRAKDKKLAELLQIPIKTIIFSDSLDYGEEISKTFEIPFVYGETKDRLSIISNAQTCVVSRVGDEGLSIPDLERVIEVAFLFGSRMQESQRFGRLMHSSKKTQHVIIMTREEFDLYQKRLQAILERGFKIEYVNA